MPSLDWRGFLALGVGLFALSIFGFTGLIQLTLTQSILANGAAFVLFIVYIYGTTRPSLKVKLQGAQPIAGNVVGELIGSSLIAYGLKEGGS